MGWKNLILKISTAILIRDEAKFLVLEATLMCSAEQRRAPLRAGGAGAPLAGAGFTARGCNLLPKGPHRPEPVINLPWIITRACSTSSVCTSAAINPAAQLPL